MKIFLDTANVEEIREAMSWGVLDGVTTNPSLVAKEGRDFRSLLLEICSIVNGPVSAEVVGTTLDEMLMEGRSLARIHENIVVKIPLIIEGLKAVKALTSEGIQVNVTLCFSASQALLAAKAGATYISPFVGRLDDISHQGLEVVRDIKTIYSQHGLPTKILAASIRDLELLRIVAAAGAHYATLPPAVFWEYISFSPELTIEGQKQFLQDWRTNRPDQ